MKLLSFYLLTSYLRVFSLSVSGFIGVLLVTRLKETARFMALGAGLMSTFRFILYQIPHILPIAIPISCLISSLILFQKMSHTHELTALRSSGISFRKIFSPILMASLWISLLNLFVISEVTTTSKQKSRKMLSENTGKNPLQLLQRQQLLNIHDSYITMKIVDDEKRAHDILMVMKNGYSDHLTLFSLEAVTINQDKLVGKNGSWITYLGPFENGGFNTLMVENQKKIETDSEALSALMKKDRFRLNPSSLPMRHLIARGKFHNDLIYTIHEILRRISLAFCAFTFTFIGLSSGVEISRIQSKKQTLVALFYGIAILCSYMYGKALKADLLLAICSFILPHVVILALGARRLRHISRGIEV